MKLVNLDECTTQELLEMATRKSKLIVAALSLTEPAMEHAMDNGRKVTKILTEVARRVRLMEGENDVLKRTNAALWDRFLGRPPSARDVRNDVVVRTVDQVLRQLGDGTAQGHYNDGCMRGTPGDGHWFG